MIYLQQEKTAETIGFIMETVHGMAQSYWKEPLLISGSIAGSCISMGSRPGLCGRVRTGNTTGKAQRSIFTRIFLKIRLHSLMMIWSLETVMEFYFTRAECLSTPKKTGGSINCCHRSG